jgi:hypothetical protein
VLTGKQLITMLFIMGGKEAARFRMECADVMVDYLGGNEKLVEKVRENKERQESLPESHPGKIFGEEVNAKRSLENHELEIQQKKIKIHEMRENIRLMKMKNDEMHRQMTQRIIQERTQNNTMSPFMKVEFQNCMNNLDLEIARGYNQELRIGYQGGEQKAIPDAKTVAGALEEMNIKANTEDKRIIGIDFSNWFKDQSGSRPEKSPDLQALGAEAVKVNLVAREHFPVLKQIAAEYFADKEAGKIPRPSRVKATAKAAAKAKAHVGPTMDQLYGRSE